MRRLLASAITALSLLTSTTGVANADTDQPPGSVPIPDGPAPAWIIADMDTGQVRNLTVIMNIGAIVGGLTFGAWSEKIGRRWAIVIAALLSLLVLPLWAFSHTAAMLAAGAFMMQVMVQGAWGIIPVHLNELSPNDARGAFPGFAYQLGNLLASGNAVWQAQIAEARGDDYSLALALVAAAVAVVIAIVTFLGPERRGVDFAAEAVEA